MVIDALTNDCSGAYVNLGLATATSDCNGVVTIKNNSPYATSHGANASGVYPIGTTVVTFTATDFCGKKSTCKTTIKVRDGKKPSPVVFYGLAISLMEDTINGGGMINLVPEWFDAGSFDNCTDNQDLLFSISPSFFNCDSLGERNVKITVTDESGNTILSYVKAAAEQDWLITEDLLNSQEVYETVIVGYNRGGVLVKVGHLRGFVPNSQLQPSRQAVINNGGGHANHSMFWEIMALSLIHISEPTRPY